LFAASDARTDGDVGRFDEWSAGGSRRVTAWADADGSGALDALVDLETPLWAAAPFTAMLLGPSDIDDVVLPAPHDPVTLLAATPITPTEAAWVRLKGADAMREAWRTDGVDVRDPRRPAAQPS
jgi:hypothetical protein